MRALDDAFVGVRGFFLRVFVNPVEVRPHEAGEGNPFFEGSTDPHVFVAQGKDGLGHFVPFGMKAFLDDFAWMNGEIALLDFCHGHHSFMPLFALLPMICFWKRTKMMIWGMIDNDKTSKNSLGSSVVAEDRLKILTMRVCFESSWRMR